ncbi:MAG: cytochrome c oxidase subunit 3 [Xanthomonadales bacterium]|nr:cytochrome c oxidase subunit 3 [Xanthomonadales bacterium]
MKFLRKVTEMPWLEPGIPDDEGAPRDPARSKMIALCVFLAVVTSVFFLFAVAYIERMELGDWDPLKEPGVLWLNTVFLVVGSMAMQRARRLSAEGATGLSAAMLLGGLMAVAFLIGQFLAWQALRDTGMYSPTHPASAFFYVLTALHGLHLLGGLYVWARTVWRSLAGDDPARIRTSIELCSVYWHYLLLVWLLLFALMLHT